MPRKGAWIAEVAEVFEKKYGQELQPEVPKRGMARPESMTEGTAALRNNFVEDLVESIEILVASFRLGPQSSHPMPAQQLRIKIRRPHRHD